MNNILKSGILIAALAGFAMGTAAQHGSNHQEQDRPACPGGGQCGMMGMGHHSDSGAMDMGIIHALVMNHDRITRTVTNLPDGIRTVTESGDPQVTKLIQQHMANVEPLVRTQTDPGLPMESPALRLILKNGDKVRTTTKITEKGVIVTQTSTEPAVVGALQKHAGEVSELVERGMATMHDAMMQNGRMRQP